MRFSNSTPDSMAPSTSSLAPKTPEKSLNFSGEQLEDALVGRIVLVQEVHDDDVVLLAVTMAAPDALFDALRIPRQVVVDDHRAELKVDALGRGFGRDHDRRFVAEVIDEGRAHVRSARAGNAVGALVVARAKSGRSLWIADPLFVPLKRTSLSS